MILNHVLRWKKGYSVIIFFGIFCLFCSAISAPSSLEEYSELWSRGKTQRIDDVYLTIEYPEKWVEFNYKSPNIDYVLNTAHVGLPSKYNGVSTVGAVYVWRYEGHNEDDAVKHVLEQPNRAGNAVFSYVEIFRGRNLGGKLIISHFGPYFGKRHGVRYDLITYSQKREQFYGFTLLVQYMKSDSDDFVGEYRVREYAEEIFNHITLKK